MVNALKSAIEKVKGLPEEQQEYAAHVLERIAESLDTFRIPKGHRHAVLKGFRQSKQKRFASAASVKKAFRSSWS